MDNMGRIRKHGAFRLVFCLLLILSLSGCGNHNLKDPALDISNASLTEFSELDEEMMLVIINGVKFENENYYRTDSRNGEDVYKYAGNVISYFINDDHYVFYCQAEGMDPGEWLIKVPDNGKGELQIDEACYIRAVDVSEIPDWLTEQDIYG
ncbi:MAG: hypothetical protein E7228_06675 [Clostridiales bacterium]|nr:hypothetical protein [Clostridiales bacterium]